LTRRLTRDNIERVFSAMRQSNGGNFHMEAKAAASALQKRLKTRIITAYAACSVGLDREKQRDYELIASKKTERRMARQC